MDNHERPVVWITGASSGIGEHLAYAYSKAGYFVILSSRNIKELERVQQALEDSSKSKIVVLDVGKYSDLEKQVRPALDEVGRIDILVNNAGISQRSKVLDTDLAVYEQIMNVNFMGSIAMTKAVLPTMIRQRSGNICVISSVNGKISVPARSGYCSSKHALHGFFESLRGEVYDDNIHVTMVVPGYIRTNVSKNALKADGSFHGKMDQVQQKGMDPAKLSRAIVKATKRNKPEISVGGKEIHAIKLYNWFPNLFRKMARGFNPT